MKTPKGKIPWLVWTGLVLATAAAGTAFIGAGLDTANGPLPLIGRIPDFSLTNQVNQAVSTADLRGKVWVADIIFTRCPGPCRTMTGKLEELQQAFPADAPVRFVTLTSDPENDTPAVMKKFAEQFKADPRRWWFLTGNKPELRSLAVNDFKFSVVEKPAGDRTVPDDLFIHSTWFALVDQEGRTRGWVDAGGHQHAVFESDDPAAMARLKSAIRQLLRQPVT
jgi:protein SCO1/2